MRTHTPEDRGSRKTTPRPALRVVLSAAMLFFTAVLSFGGSGSSRTLAGFSFGGLFPTGAFNDHVPQNGGGLGLFLGRRVGNAPVFLGFEISLNFYGYVHRHEYIEGIPEVRLDVDTFNNIGQTLLFVRLQPRRGAVMTYVEGLAGISYLWTDTTISGHDFPWNEISSDTNFDAFTVAAGAGAGLSIHLGRRRVQDPDRKRKDIFLDFKVRYMAGGRAEYLKQGSIVVEGNEFSYTTERSATSFITAQAAFLWFF
jgi:hypothetical protein